MWWSWCERSIWNSRALYSEISFPVHSLTRSTTADRARFGSRSMASAILTAKLLSCGVGSRVLPVLKSEPYRSLGDIFSAAQIAGNRAVVRTVFVFLNLLERNADLCTQVGLTQSRANSVFA